MLPSLRFLADENFDFGIVNWLRNEGYDIITVKETHASISDIAVLEYACQQGRILLTQDKDFGQLVFSSHLPSTGVILSRFPLKMRTLFIQALQSTINKYGVQLYESFVVLQPGQIRIQQRNTQ